MSLCGWEASVLTPNHRTHTDSGMEPKDGGRPSQQDAAPSSSSPDLAETAKAVLKGFLQDQGLAVDDSVDGIAAGLQALLGGDSDEEDDENAGEEAAGKGPVFVVERYQRRATRQGHEGPEELELSLASSHHSLWGHRLWNAAIVMAEMVDDGQLDVRGKDCLELGAGAALPSLLAALNGARRAVATDYASTTDRILVNAIQRNVDRLEAEQHVATGVLHALGYVWGQSVGPLLAPLNGPGETKTTNKKFDLIFCADLIFNRSEHAKLLKTCAECLDPERGQVVVSYSHHDPGKAPLDLRFFELAKDEPFNFTIEDVKMEQRVDLFVEKDGLDEERGKVYVKRLTLPGFVKSGP